MIYLGLSLVLMITHSKSGLPQQGSVYERWLGIPGEFGHLKCLPQLLCREVLIVLYEFGMRTLEPVYILFMVTLRLCAVCIYSKESKFKKYIFANMHIEIYFF